MNDEIRQQIIGVMNSHKVMTVATIRPDGYPQATTVNYVNEGLALYFVCDKNSQKVSNLKQNRKVSLTIDHLEGDWRTVRGLSLGGTAEVFNEGDREFRHTLDLITRKFPRLGEVLKKEIEAMAAVKITPEVISFIDYSKGFGHTDLVEV